MTLRAIRNIKPTAPISLTATADGGYTRMKLAWTDTSNNRKGFEVQRSDDGATGWAFVNTVLRTNWGDGVNYYTDTSLTRGNTYYYKIRGFNGAGFGRWSNVANDTIWQLSDVTLYAEYDANVDVYENAAGDDPCEDGDGVWVLKDQANSYDLTQATAANRPSYQTNELNGLPIIRHASGDILLASTAADWKFLHDGTEFAVYMVWKQATDEPDAVYALLDTGAFASGDIGFVVISDDRTSASRFEKSMVWVADGTGGGDFEALAITPDEAIEGAIWHITAARMTASNLENWNDGYWGGYASVAPDGSPSASNPTSPLAVGGRYDNTSNLVGDWARILIISGTVSDANHQAVQDYLSEEYALSDNAYFGSESVVQHDTSDPDHNGFPGICVAPNGDLVLAYTKSDSHSSAGASGQLVVRISSDNGSTWGSEIEIFDNSGTDTWGAPKPRTLSNDVIIMAVGKRESGAVVVDGVGQFTSNDNGKTWSSVTQITAPTFTAWAAEGGGIIELANGDLLYPHYGRDTGDAADRRSCAVIRSQDLGVSWSFLATIADGPTDGLNYAEAALIQITNGDVLALVREEVGADMYISTSADNGGTWGALSLIADARGANYDAIELDSGELISLVRDMTDATPTVPQENRILFSGDSGASWQMGYRFPDSPNFSTTRTSGGAVIQHDDGTIYIAYGSETTDQTTSDIMFAKTS